MRPTLTPSPYPKMIDKKKITLFADFGSEYRTGGGYTFSRELLNILQNLPLDLNILYSWCPKIDGDNSPWQGRNFYKIETSSYGFGKPEVDIPFGIKAWKVIMDLPKQDLYFLDKPSVILPLSLKVPNIAMFHGSDFIKFRNLSVLHPRTLAYALFWQKPVLNFIQNRILHFKNGGTPIFNSRYTSSVVARDFRIKNPELNELVTYLPVAWEEYQKNPESRKMMRRKLNIKDEEIVIICVSNFVSIKRPELLPEIARGVLKSINSAKVKFLFVGRKTKDSRTLDVFCEGPESLGRCIRIDEVPPEEIKYYLSAGDIAITTSSVESFGYSVAECMSASLPLVAFANSGALDELIQTDTTGFLVKTSNEFISRLVSLVKNQDLRSKMGQAGVERIRKTFSREAFKQRLLRIFQEKLGISLEEVF